MRRAVWILVLAWLAHYLSVVRRFRVSTTGLLAARIADRCASLRRIYWPTWFAHTALGQAFLLSIKEFLQLAKALLRSPYTAREVVKLRDGEEIVLDIMHPPPALQSSTAGPSDPPVVLMLHGALQASRSVTMVEPARHFASLGAPAVVMNRRGYGGLELSSARMSVFGFDDDLDDVLAAVERLFPGRLIAVFGFSAGSLYAARWVTRRASLSAWRGGPLLCTILLDCGFDADPSQEDNIKFPFNAAIALGLKYQYGFRHRKSFTRSPSGSRRRSVDKVIFSPKLQESFQAQTGLAGGEMGSSLGAWHEYSQADFSALPVPTLVINSRDDPICTLRALDRYRHRLMASPNVCLVELDAGSHGCKFSFGGGECVANRLISEFITSAAEEWREQLDG